MVSGSTSAEFIEKML